MKSLVAIALLALAFTTGFTCSKNTPSPDVPAVQSTPPEGQSTVDPQEQMAAPAVEAPPPEAGAGTETMGAGTGGAEAPGGSGSGSDEVPPK